MFTDTIKEATLTNHQQTEKVLIGMMKGMRSKQDYVNLLDLFYGYFGGLEGQINKFITAADLPEHDERRKTEVIATDLKTLGSKAPAKATGYELPTIQNKLQAFGALYVIEGSTLGGKIISKMIQQHLGITDGGGLSFFNGYGEQTQQMWDGFKESLNTIPQDPAEEKIILQAANETFIKFKNWLEK